VSQGPKMMIRRLASSEVGASYLDSVLPPCWFQVWPGGFPNRFRFCRKVAAVVVVIVKPPILFHFCFNGQNREWQGKSGGGAAAARNAKAGGVRGRRDFSWRSID